jgi:error-prone DNA polymerase
VSAGPVQLALDLGDEPSEVRPTGLPEMTGAERTRAELALLGLDASRHVVDFYVPFMTALGATRADRLRECRSRAEVFVAGVKVATQTPPVRSGRRVVFVTLDDATGPIDATFFEDAQGRYAETLFHSWLLVIRGIVRRTGPQGLSLRGTGAWDLTTLHDAWVQGGPSAVADLMADPEPAAEEGADARGVRDVDRAGETPQRWDTPERPPTAGGMGPRRVLVHPSGFRQSPYADIAPAGDSPRDAARRAAENADRRPGRGADQGTPALRKLWHSSPGSPGR